MAVVETLTVVSGTASDEQDFINSLDIFLTTTISGWNLEDTITDIPSDNDRVYSLDTAQYDRTWVRVRGNGDYVSFYAYSLWDPSSSTGADEINDSTETRIYAGTGSLDYWIMGNQDVVHIITGPNDGNYYHGGFGLWDTLYGPEEDPKPVFVFGQNSTSDTFSDTNRVFSYTPGSWGSSYERQKHLPGTTFSGSSGAYRASHVSEVQYAVSQSRTGEPYIFEPVFRHNGVFAFDEVRGEIPGLFMIGSSPYTEGAVTTISGFISGDFLIHKHSGAVSWAIGKVSPL